MSLSPKKPVESNFQNFDKADHAKQEIDDNEDWGAAEQSAFERLSDDRTGFVTGEEMLDWIKRLEAGEDV